MKKTRITNYRKAWNEFRKTSDFKELSDILKKAGIKQPYSNNIIWGVFTAGWAASGVETKIIDQ